MTFFHTETTFTLVKNNNNLKNIILFKFKINLKIKKKGWSGYFTSRPALKAYVRTRGNYLYSTNKLLSSSTANQTFYLPQIDLARRFFSTSKIIKKKKNCF